MRRVAPLLLAIAAFVAVTVLWIVTDRRASERVFDDYSSANTSEKGLSQAAAYLARRGPMAALTRPMGRAPIEKNAVVFRITHEVPVFFDPEELDEKQMGPPKPRERALLTDAEDAFVRHGGRMVIASHMGLLPTGTPVTVEAKKVFPLWSGVDLLKVPEKTSAFLELRPRMQALFVAGEHVIVARERLGDGDLFVVSWPEVFQNANLASASHLALLVTLAGKRPVYFDEVPHGIVSDDGALELMKEWNLGPFLLMLVAVAALVFWRGGRRTGPPEDEARETRSEAIDLVQSLGALYREVTPPDQALTLYYEALTRTVAHTSGLRGDALRKRVDDLTRGRRTLTGLNEGFAKLNVSRPRRAGALPSPAPRLSRQ
ncbi:MAG: hypothetical protein ABI779_03205 [Acidobacteriota bacterium]